MLAKNALVVGVLTAILSATVSQVAMSASCNPSDNADADVTASGLGSPSVSASDITTQQALQFIRKRQDEIQVASNAATIQAAPAQQQATAAPLPPAVTAPSAPQPQSSQANKKSASSSAPTYPPSLKDDPYTATLVEPSTRAAWGGAYADVEERSNVPLLGSATSIKSRQTSAGLIAGIDWSMERHFGIPGTLRMGILGGVDTSKTKYQNGVFNADASSAPTDCTDPSVSGSGHCFERFGAQSTYDGGNVGAYALYVKNAWAFDMLAKVDFGKTKVSDYNRECSGDGHGEIYRESSQDTATLSLSGNAGYRIPVSERAWIEPVAGFRYLHLFTSSPTSPYVALSDSDSIGNGTTVTGPYPITTRDGDALRLQAGLRIGTTQPLHGASWTTTLTGLVYEEVVVSGFSSSTNPSAIQLDKDKLRGLVQISTGITTTSGTSVLLQGDVRGGEDLLGYGGKIIIRQEW